MAEKELSILILARDLASRALGTVNKSVGVLQKNTSGLQRIVGAAGTAIKTVFRAGLLVAGGAIAFLIGNIKAGIDKLKEMEKVEGQTNAIIKSTKGIAGLTAKEVGKLASEYGHLTATSTKTVQAAENILLTHTKISKKVFPDALRLTLDLATAMGGNYTKAATTLGKALNDPIRGTTLLRRIGVSFTASEEKKIKTLVKTGKTMDAQRLILGKLNTLYSGRAKAAASGYEGAQRRLAGAVGGLQKALAKQFLPILTNVTNRLAGFLRDPAIVKRVEEFGKKLAGLVTKQNLDKLEGLGKNIFAKLEKIPWDAIGKGLQLAGTGAGKLMDAFIGAPPWVQAFLTTGFIADKFSGGALHGIVETLARGLIKGVLGISAAVVNIEAASLHGVGGGGGVIPGGPIGTAAEVGGLAGLGLALKKFGATLLTVGTKLGGILTVLQIVETGLQATGIGPQIEKLNKDIYARLTTEFPLLRQVLETDIGSKLGIQIKSGEAGRAEAQRRSDQFAAMFPQAVGTLGESITNASERAAAVFRLGLAGVTSVTSAGLNRTANAGLATAAEVRRKKLSVNVDVRPTPVYLTNKTYVDGRLIFTAGNRRVA